jgi:methylated-DNA-protein-cysteine methyltransferase related protein
MILRRRKLMSSFFERVYSIVARIPVGKVMTYGEIAAIIGSPRGARTVGWAMQAAPERLKLPCHRVVNRLGELATGDIFGGAEVQRAMLASEGVVFKEDGRIDMKRCLWTPDDINCEL